MIIGGDTSILMITNSIERISRTIHIGVEAPGETSIGGGIEKPVSCMTKSTNPLKGTLDGGMVFQTIKTCLLITWTFLLHGFDITKISQVFGDETELHPIG